MQTQDERRSAENGIWLCQVHAKLVDNDPGRYPVELLIKWEQLAEQAARLELEGGGSGQLFDEFTLGLAYAADLLREMRTDVVEDHEKRGGVTRDFVVLGRDTFAFNSRSLHFEYYGNRIEHAQEKVDLLLEFGLVYVAKTTDIDIYRMTNDFVQMLRAWEPDSIESPTKSDTDTSSPPDVESTS